MNQPRKRPTDTLELWFACFGLAMMSVVHRWDLVALDPSKWAILSAWLLILVAISIAQQLDDRFEQMLRRLSKRQVISLDAEELHSLLETFRRRSRVAAIIGSVMLPVILSLAYCFVLRGTEFSKMPWADTSLLLGEIGLELIAATIAGRYVGRGVFYGLLGVQLSSEKVHVHMIFGHSDGAAGLRPVGDFYFFQALAVAMPVFFFAFWVLMMPVWSSMWPLADTEFATRWKNVYVLFFFIALAVELTAFVFPLWYFHQQMKQQKLGKQPVADELSAELSQLQRASSQDHAREQAQLVERIESLESVPTWPLAPDVSKRFAMGNLALLAPAAAKMSQAVLEAFSTGLK